MGAMKPDFHIIMNDADLYGHVLFTTDSRQVKPGDTIHAEFKIPEGVKPKELFWALVERA